MDPTIESAWLHMRELGLCALAHANRHASYVDIQNGAWGLLSVLQAAHAAEILFKARIAQEHPLLIFENFPKISSGEMSYEELFSNGRTIEWNNIPNRLWATTGITLPCIDGFQRFGRLRNSIQHFGQPSNIDPNIESLRFIYNVIDPFIHQCWGLYAIDYDEDYEPYIYMLPALINREIPFLVSPDAAQCFEEWNVDWNSIKDPYKKMIKDRVVASLRNSK